VPPASVLPIRILLFVAFCATVFLAPARAQLSPEEQRKRDLFLRAREAIVPVPASTPPPAPVKPKPRPRPVTTPPPKRPAEPAPPRPKPTPRPAPVEGESGDEAVEKLPPPREAEPSPRPAPAQREEETVEKLPPPREQVEAPPAPPPPTVTPEEVPAAPITIEKSGLEEEQGLMPTPKPERRGLFGFGGPRYRYLSRGLRAAIDRAPVKRGRWQYIIVHNSGTRQGNARVFDNYHRNVRRMKNGLAYHFVIGNGTSSGDGEIEIGPRWTRQTNGGHVASDYLNNISIGICFVGDYNRDRPTEAQLAAIDELIRYLRGRIGKTKGRISIVKAHREINPKPTDCPGNRFPYRWLHRKFD
jgi:N-acetylmuramoyl-L-alanine amidase